MVSASRKKKRKNEEEESKQEKFTSKFAEKSQGLFLISS